MSLDEGLMIDILHSCAHNGDSVTAVKVISMLEKLQIVLQEHHLMPYLEASIFAGKWLDAINAISSMRSHGVAVSNQTLRTFIKLMSGSLFTLRRNQHASRQKWTDEYDLLGMVLKDARHDRQMRGSSIDIAVLNAAIMACAKSTPVRIRSAFQIYEGLETAYGATADCETYNSLITVCIAASDFAQARSILDKAKADENITPNAETYDLAVTLALEGDQLPEAVGYFDEMRRNAIVPLMQTYDAISIALGQAGKHEKVEALIRERFTHGYALGRKVRKQLSPEINEFALRIGRADQML